MSMNCDIMIVPGSSVAALVAAGAEDLGPCTLGDGLDGTVIAAADVGESLVLISGLQLSAGLPAISRDLDAPVYQAVIGETGDGFAFMAITEAGPRTRAFNDGVEVHVEGDPLTVEADLPDLDSEALLDLLTRVEPALTFSAGQLDSPATSVEVDSLLGF